MGQDREDGTFLVTTTIGGYYGGERTPQVVFWFALSVKSGSPGASYAFPWESFRPTTKIFTLKTDMLI